MANPFLVTSNKNPFLLEAEEQDGGQTSTYAGRVLKEALPAVSNIGGDILRSIPAGIRGAGQAIATGSMEEGMMGFESSMNYLGEHTPRFRDPKIQEMEAAGVAGLEQLRQAGGAVTEALKTKYNIPALVDPNYKAPMEGDPLARTMGEVAVDLAPIPGTEMIARGARGAAVRVRPPAPDAALLKRAQEQAAAEGRPVAVVLEELATGKREVVKEDLFEGEPIPVSPEARNPFILPPERIAELEAELNKPSPEQITETVRYTEATTGQRDLIDPVMSATEARPSLRSKERGPDIAELPTERVPGRAAPKLTEQELYGPRERLAEPAAGIPFTKETPPFTPPHRTSVSDQSAINERKMNEAEIAWDKKVSDFNERARVNELLKQGEEIKQAQLNIDEGVRVLGKLEDRISAISKEIDILEQDKSLAEKSLVKLRHGQQVLDNNNAPTTEKQWVRFFKETEGRIKDLELELPDLTKKAQILKLKFKQTHAADYTSLNEAIDTKLRAFVQRGDFRGSLEYIRDSKDFPPYLSYLSDVLLRDKEFNPKLVFAETINSPELLARAPAGWTVGGSFTWERGKGTTITMSDALGHAGRATTLLHEAVHAKVAFAQWAYERGGPLPRQAREAAETISGLYNYVKKHADPEFLKTHGMSDAREFMAEGFTNPEFQKVLKDMRYHPGPGEGLLKNVLTAWDAFVHSVARL